MIKTRAGLTRKPCHGCGSTEQHETEKLCKTCQGALKEAKAMVEQRALQGGLKPFLTVERHYALPRLNNIDRDIIDPLQLEMLKLSELLSTPTKEFITRSGDTIVWPYARNEYLSWETTRIFDVAVVSSIRNLYKLMREAIDAAHSKGAEEGRSLLMGLASGRITNDEFNTTATRQNERKK